jgi:hypothetical protein
MATILLIGEKLTDHENLASKLRNRGHAVLLADYRQISMMSGDLRMSSVEIVIFDVTYLDEKDKGRVREICQLPRHDGYPVFVLCYSRVNREPRCELDIERLGARFVYAE